ncbi:helix-turn-helix domain-containing protein [Nocardia vaccinii]|uniref:helix-turn-helix domain-containing protein n=1 Tax=Nocardia vaccinii TaxID=1822 RepID=UPI000835ABBD|nr:helix-turn-helix domain-containing protein [Nocardia vaccinii]
MERIGRNGSDPGADLTDKRGSGENCWDIGDVAQFFKVTPDTVREWRRNGYGPPARRVGRHLRWVPEEVSDWFRDLPMDNAA